jgi:hypothetical protein
MKSDFVGGLLAVSVSLCFASSAVAASYKYVLPEASRAFAGERAFRVHLAQEEIKTDINPSNMADDAAGQGGLFGALILAAIDAKVEADRAKKAEALIQPIRTALTGYDAEAQVLNATQATAAKVPWLKLREATLSKDDTVVSNSAFLDADPSEEVVFFDFTYDTSPDFSSLRVGLKMQVARKAVPSGKAPTARLQIKNLVFAQTITTIVTLPAPYDDKEVNAARWSANDGKLARQALTTAFEKSSALAVRALEIRDADVKAMNTKDHKRFVMAGFTGRKQEEGPDGTLLFNGDLVHVQTLVE